MHHVARIFFLNIDLLLYQTELTRRTVKYRLSRNRVSKYKHLYFCKSLFCLKPNYFFFHKALEVSSLVFRLSR